MGVEKIDFDWRDLKTKSGFTQPGFCKECEQVGVLMKQQFSHGVWHYFMVCPDCYEKTSGSIARKELYAKGIALDDLEVWTPREYIPVPACPDCGVHPRMGRTRQDGEWVGVWYCVICVTIVAPFSTSYTRQYNDRLSYLPNLDALFLKSLPYDDYLKTPHWQRVRWAAKWVSGDPPRCQLCSAEDNLQVHHRDYKRRGFERPEDLTVLCADCHTKYSLDKRAEKELVDR